MSQQFLNQIFRVENEIVERLVVSLLQSHPDSREPCCICLQKYGTLSSETGAIECEIRLPCSHRVGSACIAIWLRTNNTCPICRRVFFPAQSRPDLQRDLLAAEDFLEGEIPSLAFEGHFATVYRPLSYANVVYLSKALCEELILSRIATNITWQMAKNIDHNIELEDPTPRLTVSVTLYMVTHIMNEYRPLEEISRVSDVHAEEICRAYRQIQPIREGLIQSHMLGALRGGTLQDFLDQLPAPNAENGFTDHEDAGSDLEHHLIPAQTKQLEELCNQYSDELAHFGSAREICPQIARKVRTGLYLAGLSPLPVVAVSLFMASHLASFGTPIREISEVVGVSGGTIRNAYRSVYARRIELINSDMLDMCESMRRFRVLRAITWPAL